MTPEQQAIAGLWIVLQGAVGYGVKWLVNEMNRREAACEARIAKLETRQDEWIDSTRRLADALQQQVDAHALTIDRLTTSEAKR
ncbi:MAG TPA: hypothetical protein VK689_21425 [Armatimonadota bacterium]|nr:hypothetical protein [Armatimonadota bacterium]